MNPDTNTSPAPAPITEPTPMAPPPVSPTPSKNVLAVISMVLGILAFLNGVYFMGAAFGIVAIILGLLALKKRRGGKGFALTGIILGSIGAICGITFTVLFLNGTIGSILESYAPEPTASSITETRQKALIDSKKKFEKGETARFGYTDVTVNSVSSDFEKDARLDEGQEYVKVNLTLTNKDASSQQIAIDLRLKVDGTVYNWISTGATINFEPLQPGESTTGDLFFIAKENGKSLSLQYTQEDVYDFSTGKSKRLVWSLEL